jgi:hypothetical protein
MSLQGGTVFLGGQASFHRSTGGTGSLAWLGDTIEYTKFFDKPSEGNFTVPNL